MNLKIFNILLIFLFGGVLIIGSAFAEGDGKDKRNRLNKINGAPIRAFMNINNISTVIKNDGVSDIDVAESNSGLVYPKGSGKQAVFTSGLVWGAFAPGDPQVRVGGTTYATGLQAGRILPDGTAEGDLDHVRIYRVRPTVFPGGPDTDVSVEATDEGKSEADIRAQYNLDWTEWPAIYGAPFFDAPDENGVSDGIYDPDPSSGDIPGVPGADQSIWFVANDLEPGLTRNLYGADPLGVELQATFWAYAQTGALGNMFFRKYRLINRSGADFEDMYMCFWSDVDLGNSTDDFVAVDTTLSLSMCYNANANDPTYNPLPPPVVGFDFFQGPIVDGVAGEDRNKNGVDDAVDFGIFGGKVVGPGRINLPMTAAFYFTRGAADVTDPTLAVIEGSNEFYNFMQGKIGITGEFFVNPITGENTVFVLTGDVPTREGWIDGILQGPGDRRQGLSSGPFTMADGDTQEVVIAEILAGATPAVDRISAIGLNKFYDQVAQVAYDNFFDLPTPPPAPSVTVAELDGQIVLDWSKNTVNVIATESSDSKGYVFQGYNVYQLPTAASQVGEGVRVATYDVIDGVGKINDLIFDPVTGSVIIVPVQFGNDTGIKRYFATSIDEINERPMINGIKYYFAVTAYNFNPSLEAVPNNLENPIAIITIIPNSNNPGVTLGDGTGEGIDVTHTNGLADGGPVVTIVDPTATTGDNYEVTYVTEPQVRNEEGFWVPAGTTRIFGPDTLTGTTITAAGVFGPGGGDVNTELFFHLDVVHHYYGWVDGVILTFPSNVTIISSPSFEAGGGTVDPVIIGQQIFYGVTDGSETLNGIFHDGGEDWPVLVGPIGDILPVTIDWVAFDDGYDGGGPPLPGTTTVTTLGTATRNADLWTVTNKSTNQIVLDRRSVVDGTVLYPPTDFFNTNVGVDAAPIADGFQINQIIGYAAPVTFADPLLTLNGESLRRNSGRIAYDDYTAFGVIPAIAANSSLGIGTSDPTLLVQDYEMRFNGVTEIQNINGVDVEVTVSGGQMATIYGARGYDIAIHPLNPNPGSSDPFAFRIPFEVWSIDQDKQINYMIYDRVGNPADDPPFRAWNTMGRMYTAFVLSDYSETAIPLSDPSLPAGATWNTVWWGCLWESDDVIQVFYANNIVPGLDTYAFTTTGAGFSDDLARSQVNDINVFPNPYYGINSEEINKYNRFVTFNHLPEKAKVRIFNLAGVLVKTIDKDDVTQFLRWDLANQDGLPVASGLYIAYIELSDLGETKILKLAIVQEQQILDRF